MGNKLGCGKASLDPDSAWKLQNKEMAENPMYKFVDLARGGKLIKAYEDFGPDRVKEIARMDMVNYLYDGGKGGHVSQEVYLQWCEMMKAKARDTTFVEKSKEELLNNYHEDKFNKFEPHDACWDMFKRGGVGETPFHLCYLMDTPVHFEVGKALMEVFPKLALDVYEGEEYFGESALHIAVILGDMEAVQLLVKNGANVHQRATGRFFLPEDQKNKPVKETNYSGYCYYGEYPLAFAACRGNEELYDFLIDHGADPNAQDSFGNTVLHMLVIHEQSKLFKHAVRHPKSPARTDILNKQNLTALTLASKLGRSHIFKEMLDLGSIEFWRFSNTICSVYPLAAIDSIGPSGETNWHSALMIIVNGETDEHLEMLEGGVIRQLLDDKWKTFAKRRFIERLIIAVLHLLLLSVAIYTRPEGDKLLSYSGPRDGVRYFAEVVVCVSCVITIVNECIEIASQGFWTFLRNCSHAPDQTVYLIACLLILACIPFRVLKLSNVEDVLLIIAAPGSWFFLLFFARVARLTGPFVTMIYKMVVGDLFRFAIIYCIFLVGFTQGFFFLFRDVDSDNADVAKFSNLPETILNLFQMTLGEFKYAAFDYSRYSTLTKFVFAIFMILMPILLLNMLIAMMGNTYNQVIAKSEKEWRKQWAKIVVVLERGFSKKQLRRFQMEYSVKLAGPPKYQLGEYCDSNMEQRALVVIKSTTKSRAKMIKAAVLNWKKLGKEVTRQMREWKVKGSKGTFTVQKRRGTIALEDMGLPNLSGAVAQLAWEKDINLVSGATPRSPGEGPSHSEQEKAGEAREQAPPVANGGPALPNGSAVQQLHQQNLTAAVRRPRNLVYNRVAPLLPPLPQEDNSALPFIQGQEGHMSVSDQGDGTQGQKSKSISRASVVALDLKSLSSWGETTEPSVTEETPRPLLSPKKGPGLGGFKSQEGNSQSPRKSLSGESRDIEAGRLSPRKVASSGTFKDLESGVGVETAITQSEVPEVAFSPEGSRHKKKKGKSGKQSKENSPKKSVDVRSDSPHPPSGDFDSLGQYSQGHSSQDQADKDSSA
ncbi:uncharacterized protein LOC143299692 [Babylonia areolata]|uniref:uncharacterized protein LOC143299692 n=1 Tax=Babylonia areolata TaxID=304850 RepID=UPI003FD4CE27